MKRNSHVMAPVYVPTFLEEHYTVSCECLVTIPIYPLVMFQRFSHEAKNQTDTLLEDEVRHTGASPPRFPGLYELRFPAPLPRG